MDKKGKKPAVETVEKKAPTANESAGKQETEGNPGVERG
jgi:hypothetical protein